MQSILVSRRTFAFEIRVSGCRFSQMPMWKFKVLLSMSRKSKYTAKRRIKIRQTLHTACYPCYESKRFAFFLTTKTRRTRMWTQREQITGQGKKRAQISAMIPNLFHRRGPASRGPPTELYGKNFPENWFTSLPKFNCRKSEENHEKVWHELNL